MPSIVWVRGDENFYPEFEIRDLDGKTQDITGASIVFKMQKYGAETWT